MILALITLAFSASSAPAAEVREEVLSVRTYIHEHCPEWKSLKEARVDCGALRAKIDEVGADRILIQEQVALADGLPRSGRNRPSIPDITISSLFWAAAASDPVRQAGFLLHEYLGLMGLEGTDDYHISWAVLVELRQLLQSGAESADFFRPKDLFVAVSPKEKCVNVSGIWRFYDEGEASRIGERIEQKGCEKITKRMISFTGNKKYQLSPFQDTNTVILAGGQRERFENSLVHLDAPVDNPVIYTADFLGDTFVDRQYYPLNSICPEQTSTYRLKDKDTLIIVDKESCLDGRKLTITEEYRRVR